MDWYDDTGQQTNETTIYVLKQDPKVQQTLGPYILSLMGERKGLP